MTVDNGQLTIKGRFAPELCCVWDRIEQKKLFCNQKYCCLLAKRYQMWYNVLIISKEVLCMAKTANVFTRVDPEIKEQAENILNQLGIPMSNAVGMFLRQVVLQKGIPFEMKLPAAKPLNYNQLSKEELDAALQEGYDDIINGRVVSAEEVKAEMKQRYGI